MNRDSDNQEQMDDSDYRRTSERYAVCSMLQRHPFNGGPVMMVGRGLSVVVERPVSWSLTEIWTRNSGVLLKSFLSCNETAHI